jgi:hypothetical protein
MIRHGGRAPTLLARAATLWLPPFATAFCIHDPSTLFIQKKLIPSLFDRFSVVRCHLDAILVLRGLLYKQPKTPVILIPSKLSSPLFRSLLALSPRSNGQPRQPKHQEKDDPLRNRPQQNSSQRPKF